VSQENVEIAKALFAAFADRDFEAAARLLDPDLEVRPAIVGGPERAVYHGPKGMKQFWDDVDAAWEEFRITADEFHELDGGVLVLGRAHAQGRTSGIALDAQVAWMFGLRDGRIVDFESFSSRRAALEAAGVGGSLRKKEPGRRGT